MYQTHRKGAVPTRILHVSPYFPPHIGGLENHVEVLSQEQGKLGHDVSVLTSTSGGTLPGGLWENGIRVRRLRSFKLGDDTLPLGMFRTLMRENGTNDIVHLHGHLFYSTTLGAMHRRLHGAPTVMTFHGDYKAVTPAGRWMKRVRDLTQGPIILNSLDGMIALTRFDKARLMAMGMDEGRISIVPNGVDLDVFQPVDAGARNEFRERFGVPEDAPMLLFLGKLLEQKGFLDLLRAMPRVLEQVPDAHLMVLGEGPDLPRGRQMVRREGIGNFVTFAGRMCCDDLVTAYGAAQVVTLPSHSEGMPLVILEAAATGRPVVATSVSGIPEFVEEGKTGSLVPPSDPESLSDALVDYLGDDALSRQVGARALAKARKEFDLRVQVSRTIKAYQGVIDHAR
jgi:glycosyltransferase involved in cell wall biosynthesis